MKFTRQGGKPLVSATAAAIKRRQALVAGGALVAVGLALIGAVAFIRASKAAAGSGLPEKPVPLSVVPAGAGVDPKDAWRGQEGTRIDRLEHSVAELTDLMKRQEAGKEQQGRQRPGCPASRRGCLQGCRRLPPPPPPARVASVVPLPPPTSVPGRPAALSPGQAMAVVDQGIESGEMGLAPDTRPQANHPADKDKPAKSDRPGHPAAICPRVPSSGRCCWRDSTPPPAGRPRAIPIRSCCAWWITPSCPTSSGSRPRTA